MRIVVAVNWEEESRSAVQEVGQLYRPTDLVLVHVVALGALESYALRPSLPDEAREALVRARQALLDAATRRFEEFVALVPHDVASVKTRCEVGMPAATILDAVRSEAPDLLVVGHRGLGVMAELAMGSVSHRLLLHAPCSTLVFKGTAKPPQRVLLAVEGPEDAERLLGWIRSQPFRVAVEMTILHVVPRPRFTDPRTLTTFEPWTRAAVRAAEEFVTGAAAMPHGPGLTVRDQVLCGEPLEVIAQEAGRYDLLVVGSHGRRGLGRFLLGSVSHSLVHRVGCPVLVVR